MHLCQECVCAWFCVYVSPCADMLVYVCPREKESSERPCKALCCSHGLLSGCPEVPLWLQGGCFVVVNWAGPGRAGVILGTACFPPLSHSVFCSFLLLLFFCIDISDLRSPQRREGVVFIARQKKKTALPFPLIFQPMGFVCVCVCVTSALHIILVSTQQL